VLDTSVLFGVIPSLYGWTAAQGKVSLDTYFAMARGNQKQADATVHHHHHHYHQQPSTGVPALEMTKWFDTNYHYIVPEFSGPDQTFSQGSTKPLDEYLEAKALGYQTRPVLLGPFSFLKLGKSTKDPNFNAVASLLPLLLPVYASVLRQLNEAGADWVQIDEPCVVLDLTDAERSAIKQTYDFIARQVPSLHIMLATYFGPIFGANLSTIAQLPVAGVHVDLIRSNKEQFDQILKELPPTKIISLGVIDGRNIWRSDLQRIVDDIVKPVVTSRGADNVQVAPSCSLLHVPVDLDLETGLANVKQWLSFSLQKMTELVAISHAAGTSDASKLPSFVVETLAASTLAASSRKASSLIHNPSVVDRVSKLEPSMYSRRNPYSARTKVQKEHFGFPDFPTTTIGSFPQTGEVRKARASFANGSIKEEQYNNFLREQTKQAIKWQEEIGLDVIVHGEFERNDMVQYFAEQLRGYAFTVHGWVQSYGSRCVRPPIIYGDISREKPMSVDWWKYSQSLTSKPLKGMLTGPVTMLNWSFVRDDMPRKQVCTQLALAIRDEVLDLEKTGAKIIQIDEAALREGLPLLKSDWPAYLTWAVDCFRLASSGVSDATQIHTHMCYSEFNAIIDSIGRLDADVLSIETSRSKMELLDAFKTCHVRSD